MTPPDHLGDDGTPHAGDGAPALSAARLRGVLDGTYASIDGGQLIAPSGLRRWWQALGDGLYGTASIACVGDSITKGAYANNAATGTLSDNALWVQRGWVGQLRTLLATQYGAVAEGFIPQNDPRVTFTGGASASSRNDIAFHGAGTALGAGATITYALPACTDIDVVIWVNTTPSQAISYTIDGGASTPIAAMTGADTFQLFTISGLSNTTHTLVLTGPASGNAYIGGVICRQNATGVRVNNVGKSGATAADAWQTANGFNARVLRLLKDGFGANLTIVALGTNDAANQSPTPSVYASNLQQIITYQTGTNGGCVLLMSEPRRAVPNGLTYSEQDYYDQMKALALANDHVAYLDVQPVFGTYAQATTGTSLYQDTIHPNRKGHGLIARTLYRALTTPPRYPGA